MGGSVSTALSWCQRSPTLYERLNTIDTRISLTNTNLDDAGVEVLARTFTESDQLSHVIALNLGHNPIGDRGAASLARIVALASLPLRDLHLSCCELNDSGVACLAAALQTNVNLKVLDLNNNVGIGDSSAGMLEQVLTGSSSHCRLEQLSMVATCITAVGAASLARIVSAGRLQSLWLGGTQIEDEGAAALATAVTDSRSALTYLSLESCSLSDASATAFSVALSRQAGGELLSVLHSLVLDGNHDIGDGGAEALANVVCSNVSFHCLALGNTSVADSGVHRLSEALRHRPADASPLTLSLEHCNQITPVGATVMTATLQACVSNDRSRVVYTGPGAWQPAEEVALELN
jgi:hypothetical protein